MQPEKVVNRTLNLFEDTAQCQSRLEELCRGAIVLRAFALTDEAPVLAALGDVIAEAPPRHMVTPGGFRMSVALTNCGSYGWVTDHSGYRYQASDPDSGKPWPRMPDVFRKVARDAAATAGFEKFNPTHASSTVTSRGRESRCIRTRMSATLTRRLFPFRLAYPLFSCGAVYDGRKGRCVCN